MTKNSDFCKKEFWQVWETTTKLLEEVSGIFLFLNIQP
jgi:hypothetical protein